MEEELLEIEPLLRWHELLRDYTGLRLSEDEAARWERAIKEELNADPFDIAEAVKFKRDISSGPGVPKSKAMKKPTLQNLGSWIKHHWSEKGRKSRESSFIAAVKGCAENGTPRTRWDRILDPMSYNATQRNPSPEELALLIRWIRTRWHDIRRPIYPKAMTACAPKLRAGKCTDRCLDCPLVKWVDVEKDFEERLRTNKYD